MSAVTASQEGPAVSPYADTAWLWRKAGWRGVIPLPAGQKSPPPKGYTGWAGLDPSGADTQAWIEDGFVNGNVALHLPTTVYGIDVDGYEGKRGPTSLAQLQLQAGCPLPPTVSVTSRGPGQPSRIRLFRAELPVGRVWLDKPGGESGGIEAIHTGHRYVVAPPSVHPNGNRYVAYAPDEVTPLGGVFTVDELAELPGAWIKILSKPGEVLGGSSASHRETLTVIHGFRPIEPEYPMCGPVTALLSRELTRIAEAGAGRGDLHNPAPLYSLVCYGIEAHRGVREALARHHDAYVHARTAGRGGSSSAAEGEWWRMVQGAVGKAGGPRRSICDCGGEWFTADIGTISTERPDWMMPEVEQAPWLQEQPQGGTAPVVQPPVMMDMPSSTAPGAVPLQAVAPIAESRVEESTTNLPVEFWESRGALKHIRKAALSRMLSPDAVLAFVLVRLSSFIKPSVRVDTGLGEASLNFYAVAVGNSAAGKTQAWSAARKLLPGSMSGAEELISGETDGLPIGSGEGMTEIYYGIEQVPTGEEYASGPRKGEQKTKAERRKVFSHASFFVDEGEAFCSLLERSGSTLAQTTRSMWVGETAGNTNASMERRRILPAGSYALGLAMAFQPEKVEPLLGDSAGGTPQRFVFLSAQSNEAAEAGAGVPFPGPLNNIQHALPVGGVMLELPASAKLELRAWKADLTKVGAVSPGLNGHQPLHLTKLSALLAILDLRTEITEEDWRLAHQVWAMSCTIRDGLASAISRTAAQRRTAEDERALRLRANGALAERAAIGADIDRVARRVAARVHDDGVRRIRGRDGLKATTTARDRCHLDEAIVQAASYGWITVVDGDVLAPGEVRPV